MTRIGRVAEQAMKAVRAGASKLEKKLGQKLRRERVRRALKTAAKTAAVAGVGLLATAAVRKSRALMAANGKKVSGSTAGKVAAKGTRPMKRRAVAR